MGALGTRQCLGYPKGTTCITNIPNDGRGVYCRFCIRTRELLGQNRAKAEKNGWREAEQ